MISQDDIDAMKPVPDYATDPVFQKMQFFIRLAFEEGYRAARPETEPHEWRPAWRVSQGRKFLLDNGLITGEEGYK